MTKITVHKKHLLRHFGRLYIFVNKEILNSHNKNLLLYFDDTLYRIRSNRDSESVVHSAKSVEKKTILTTELLSKMVEYDSVPDDVVDADYVLLLGIFGVADNSGTCLHPRISAILVHHSVILRHHLPLVDHCKGRFVVYSTEITWESG